MCFFLKKRALFYIVIKVKLKKAVMSLFTFFALSKIKQKLRSISAHSCNPLPLYKSGGEGVTGRG